MERKFISTRGDAARRDLFEAVLQGLADDGGLFVPDFPFTALELSSLQGLSYDSLATRIISTFAPEGSEEAIAGVCRNAYASGAFPEEVVPVRQAGSLWVAELYHGPTAAFKDMALQLLPHLMTLSLRQRGEGRTALILAATSGDTGKAALEGFADVEGTRIRVFYPSGGVSSVQRQQMITQRGANVEVTAIHGNFDDAQRAVKEAFASEELMRACHDNGLFLTSANSINIGRLLPQIVYYFHAYLTLVQRGALQMGDAVDFSIPSGNFGDCLAGVMARRMGLPVRRFIVASNHNNVLTDFFCKGVYDIRRPFFKTNSPAMDILVSSNLERLLHFLSDGDTAFTARCMAQLKSEKYYQVSDAMRERLHDLFVAGWQNEEETLATIRRYWDAYGYLADTHTAVALGVCDALRSETSDDTPIIVLSTASPYKFPASVHCALTGRDIAEEEAMEALHRVTSLPVPACLDRIMDRPVLHTGVIDAPNIVSHIIHSAV